MSRTTLQDTQKSGGNIGGTINEIASQIGGGYVTVESSRLTAEINDALIDAYFAGMSRGQDIMREVWGLESKEVSQ
jgi:hypothetical protein